MSLSFLSLIYLDVLEILVQQRVSRHGFHGFLLCYEQKKFHDVCLIFLSLKSQFFPKVIREFLYLSTI